FRGRSRKFCVWRLGNSRGKEARCGGRVFFIASIIRWAGRAPRNAVATMIGGALKDGPECVSQPVTEAQEKRGGEGFRLLLRTKSCFGRSSFRVKPRDASASTDPVLRRWDRQKC